MVEINRELMAKVRDRIAEVGDDHCNMGIWANSILIGYGEPKCGTAGCIAGWTIAVKDGEFNWDKYVGDFNSDACEALFGIKYPTPTLFFTAGWPEKYREIRSNEGDAKAMIAILDDLLDGHLDPEIMAYAY